MKVVVIGPAKIDDQEYVNRIIHNSEFNIDLLVDPMLEGPSFRALVWALHEGVNVLHVPAYNKNDEEQTKAICDIADAMIVILDNRSRKSTAMYKAFKETGKPIYEVKRTPE